MNNIYRIVVFTVFFNLACIFVAATDWFGDSVFYGSVFKDIDANSGATETFNAIFSHGAPFGSIWGYDITLFGLFVTILAVVGVVGLVSKQSPQIFGMFMVGAVFLTMYVNSADLMYKILHEFDSIVNYLGLILGVGVLIMLVMTLMEYATGQSSRS